MTLGRTSSKAVLPKNIVHLVQQRLTESLSKCSWPRILRAMSICHRLFQTILRTISALREGAGYLFTCLWALLSPRATLVARVLAAESQLAMCKRRIEEKNQPRPRFTRAFRLLWVLLARVWDPWHQMAGNLEMVLRLEGGKPSGKSPSQVTRI